MKYAKKFVKLEKDVEDTASSTGGSRFGSLFYSNKSNAFGGSKA